MYALHEFMYLMCERTWSGWSFLSAGACPAASVTETTTLST